MAQRRYNPHKQRNERSYQNQRVDRSSSKEQDFQQRNYKQRHNKYEKNYAYESQRQTSYDSKSERYNSQNNKSLKKTDFHQENKLFVGGINPDTNEDCIRKQFCKFGKITDLKLINKGSFSICFVSFQEVNQMELALNKMNGKNINGKSVFIQKARPKGDKNFGGKQFQDKKSDGCFNCGQLGHFARQCSKPRKPRDFNKNNFVKQQKNFKAQQSERFTREKSLNKSGKTDSGSQSSLEKSRQKRNKQNSKSKSRSKSKSPPNFSTKKNNQNEDKKLRKRSISRSASPKRQCIKQTQDKKNEKKQKKDDLKDPRDRTRDKNTKKRKNSSESDCSN